MAKRSSRNLSKKGLDGLKRVGKWPNKMWEFAGKKFKTLREVVHFARSS